MGEATASSDDLLPAHRFTRNPSSTGPSLMEKITRVLRDWRYRSFLHQLRLQGRFALQLQHEARDCCLGDPDIGKTIIAGRIEYRDIGVNLDHFSIKKLEVPVDWLAWFHSFRWLRDVAACNDSDFSFAVTETIVKLWLQSFDSYHRLSWSPDILGERLTIWLMHSSLLFGSDDNAAMRTMLLKSMTRQAKHLAITIRDYESGLGRIKAACGLTMAALLLTPRKKDLGLALHILSSELNSFISVDGQVATRSPEDGLTVLVFLVNLHHLYTDLCMTPPDILEKSIGRLAATIKVMRFSNGLLSTMHGGGLSNKELISTILGDADKIAPFFELPQHTSGFQRMDANNTTIIIDVAPPPPCRLSDHGHAGTLGFELVHDGQHLIVNCGSGQDASLRMAANQREFLRSTDAHSTLVLGGRSSTQIRDDALMDHGVSEVAFHAINDNSDAGQLVDACHDGYVSSFGYTHSRRIFLGADGNDIRGEDRLIHAIPEIYEDELQNSDLIYDLHFHLGFGVRL